MVSVPAGAAALLGYLKAYGIADFRFLDLRLGTPSCYEATYSSTVVIGESVVLDVPGLPLILQLLDAADSMRVICAATGIWRAPSGSLNRLGLVVAE